MGFFLFGLLIILCIVVDDFCKIVKVVVLDGKIGDVRDFVYINCKVIGNGLFGIVFQVKFFDELEGFFEIVIKKVLQDKRFKVCGFFMCCVYIYLNVVQNCELQIMRFVKYFNVVDFKVFFYLNGDKVRVFLFFCS